MKIEFLKDIYYIFLFCCLAALLTARLDIPRGFDAPDHYMTPDPEGWEILMSTDNLAKADGQLSTNMAIPTLRPYGEKYDSGFHVGFSSSPTRDSEL
jgi:hypothetical protein